MIKKTHVVRNSLITLALGVAASSVAWSGEARTLGVPAHGAAAAPVPHQLNLTPPDIHDVMSADELNVAMPNPDEPELGGSETVQVHGAPPPPYVPGGFAALWWGATHPAQAWRILTPAQ